MSGVRVRVIFIDLQREYLTKGRPFYLNNIFPSLNNAKRILELARQEAWEIVHIQHFRNVPDSLIFNRSSEFSGFIKGFEPRSDERYFEKNSFSCYSNPAFAAFMEESRGEQTYVVGYGTSKCVLATVVDGFNRGHKLIVISDATYAKAELGEGLSEEDMHRVLLATIKSSFANLIITADLCRGFEKEDLLSVEYFRESSVLGPMACLSWSAIPEAQKPQTQDGASELMKY